MFELGLFAAEVQFDDEEVSRFDCGLKGYCQVRENCSYFLIVLFNVLSAIRLPLAVLVIVLLCGGTDQYRPGGPASG